MMITEAEQKHGRMKYHLEILETFFRTYPMVIPILRPPQQQRYAGIMWRMFNLTTHR